MSKRAKKSEYGADVLSVPCPSCGAYIGEVCRDAASGALKSPLRRARTDEKTGDSRREPHASRVAKAEAS